MVSWQFLLVGSFAAIGAAMVVGTVGAAIHRIRTGVWPQESVDDGSSTLTRGQVAGLVARAVVGVVILVAGLVSLRASGAV